MIIFYDKETGIIQGTVDGRIHDQVHLNMWIGDKDKVDRLICQWKATPQWEPDCPDDQKQIYLDLDKQPSLIFNYKVDVNTKKLITK